MRRLVDGLGEADLQRAVNDSWTVSGVLGHIAFWDGRALALTRKLEAGVPFSPADDEPDDIDWVNDASRAFVHAVPPSIAARAALEVAEETDRRIAGLTPDLAARSWPLSEDSPLNLLRADHRGEHLDEIEAALSR
jgi:hypothetical protein